MRTLFLHRRWCTTTSIERATPAAHVRRALGRTPEALGLRLRRDRRDRTWFHAHYGLAERLAQPAAPALPDPQGRDASRGDFVAFHWAGGGPYPAGVTFIKVLAGMPGDEVTRDAQGFHLNGVPMGVPKPVSRRGQPLEPGPTGRIPEGLYYVRAGHPDSLDSRYQLTGWIHASQIIGRADALF